MRLNQDKATKSWALARRFRVIFLALVAIFGASLGAAAQSFAIPEASSTAPASGTATVTVTDLPTSSTDDATVTMTLFGDVGFPGESLAISFDGVPVSTIDGIGGDPACTTGTQVFTVPQATLAPLIADGAIVVTYQASVGVGNVCNPAGGTGVFGGPGAQAFRISGTLAYTGPPPPVTAPESSSGAVVDSNTQFLAGRARSLVQNQPNVLRFVDGRIGGAFSAEVTQGRGAFDLSSGAYGPVWGTLQGSTTDTNAGDQDYAIGAFGLHRQLGANAVVGAMVQLDYAQDTLTDGTETSGTGWLVGPYFATQLGAQRVFAEGRLLYGRTDNSASTPTGVTGEFDGDRWLANLGLEGQWKQKGFTLIPGLDVSYVEDTQFAYTDSAAAAVAEQSVTYTDVVLGMGVEMPLGGAASGFIVTGGVAGVWSDTDQSVGAARVHAFDDGIRGRVDLGFRYEGGERLQSTGNLFVDGVGSGDATTVGAELGVYLSF